MTQGVVDISEPLTLEFIQLGVWSWEWQSWWEYSDIARNHLPILYRVKAECYTPKRTRLVGRGADMDAAKSDLRAQLKAEAE